ncbi:glycosyltransferase family 4 protein [Psychromonas sp. 14N.309.X.WAT.B.A12]|uniref:glycosyltransferase family 4 protein n=1 Tax=Psychromonas sp. 14N.309.X.WAT.B.A12 TaxID=2998322 RepID=UPI0025AF965A|nr:glycosyltransferase family 4 protein [Psychromonas sp. 14N.309.X.WAT.B.A12]MDN2662797.1 glycosyltransferase family 4 protein [Psychromonas sp. 14N.309.X.WAT.B.A12]
MLNICLVAHFAYGAVTGGSHGSIGGVERQTSLMAKWLVARGHKVSLLTWSEGSDEDEVIEGINVIKICRQDSGLKGLRFFHPRWTGLNSAMKRADADIYYQNCGEYITGQVALWCKLHNKKFLYSLANDSDADYKLPVMNTYRERILYRYGLANADYILSQTKKQMNSLKSGFKLNSEIMPMPCPGPNRDEYEKIVLNQKSPSILWAARIHESKRLELFLEVAKSLPEYQFIIGGSPKQEDAYFKSVLNTMNKLHNVTYLGMVARADMPNLYRSASVFCCSSVYEGFPNTFLEAWSQGVPIVSTFDPDHLIRDRELGFDAVTKDDLVSGIRKLCSDPELWQQYSNNAREYYVKNHSVNQVMERFEAIFAELSQ